MTDQKFIEFPDYVLAKNQIDSPENRRLFQAALSGSLNDARVALEQGAKPNFFFRPEDSKNSLHVAAENGHAALCELLIEHGAQVDGVCLPTKSTALHFAAIMGNDHVVNVLLSKGANVNAVNGFGNTPLHEAASADSFTVVQLLLDAGGNPMALNKKGSIPLHFACLRKGASTNSVKISEELIRRGSPVDFKDSDGRTPFLICSSSGRVDLMDVLVKAGADVSVKDKSNLDAKRIAEFHRQGEVLESPRFK